MSERNERAYRKTLAGLSLIVRLLVCVLVVVFLIYIGRAAYHFGYAVFHETGVQNPPGTDVTVVIPDGASSEEIAAILKDSNLISDERLFLIEERLSDDYGEMKGGVYTLNTSETPSELIADLAGDSSGTESSDG